MLEKIPVNFEWIQLIVFYFVFFFLSITLQKKEEKKGKKKKTILYKSKDKIEYYIGIKNRNKSLVRGW